MWQALILTNIFWLQFFNTLPTIIQDYKIDSCKKNSIKFIYVLKKSLDKILGMPLLIYFKKQI